jgi:toxin ParE1/3/4
MVKLSHAAAQDIEDLLNHSMTHFGLDQTEIYYQYLSRCLDLIGENPEIGYAADDIRPGYRRFPHESHVVFYKIEAHDVFVVRILHKSMDAVRNLPD